MIIGMALKKLKEQTIMKLLFIASLTITCQLYSMEQQAMSLHDEAMSLHDAAKLGNYEAIENATAKDVNRPNKLGFTLLDYAVKGGHPSVCQLLIGKGASPTAKDGDGNTPLHTAASAGHVEVCKLLIDSGASPTEENNSGSTPLHYAAWRGHPSVCQLLINRGASPTEKDIFDSTPLHKAAEKGHLKVCELLISEGASLEEDHWGCTPLAKAAEWRHIPCARLLLRNGAQWYPNLNWQLDVPEQLKDKTNTYYTERANYLKPEGLKNVSLQIKDDIYRVALYFRDTQSSLPLQALGQTKKLNDSLTGSMLKGEIFSN